MRLVRATYDDDGVMIYQAFKPKVVAAAVAAGTFSTGFGRQRRTWIKSSFGWILHRSGYARKHRQQAIIQVKLSHEGFLAILRQSVPSFYDHSRYDSKADWQKALKQSLVIHQWDPDYDLRGRPLDQRALQVGISGAVVDSYVDDWILSVRDVTDWARQVEAAVRGRRGQIPELPEERAYELPEDIFLALACRAALD